MRRRRLTRTVAYDRSQHRPPIWLFGSSRFPFVDTRHFVNKHLVVTCPVWRVASIGSRSQDQAGSARRRRCRPRPSICYRRSHRSGYLYLELKKARHHCRCMGSSQILPCRECRPDLRFAIQNNFDVQYKQIKSHFSRRDLGSCAKWKLVHAALVGEITSVDVKGTLAGQNVVAGLSPVGNSINDVVFGPPPMSLSTSRQLFLEPETLAHIHLCRMPSCSRVSQSRWADEVPDPSHVGPEGWPRRPW